MEEVETKKKERKILKKLRIPYMDDGYSCSKQPSTTGFPIG